MESSARQEKTPMRFSNSPRRRTEVTEAIPSPTRSVYVEHISPKQRMESIGSQMDFGHRTTDFFEYSSDEEATERTVLPPSPVTAAEVNQRERPVSTDKGKQPVQPTQPVTVQRKPRPYGQRTRPESYERPGSHLNDQISQPVSPGTSVQESMEDIDPLSGRPGGEPQLPKPVHLSSGLRDRDFANLDVDRSQRRRSSAIFDKMDHRLGLHDIAHDILLRGLLNDEEVMRWKRPLDEPLMRRHSAEPDSMHPQRSRPSDARSLHVHPMPKAAIARSASPLARKANKAYVVPAPINTQGVQRSRPRDLEKTPYPFSFDNIHRADSARGQQASPLHSPAEAFESILTLSIRRSNPNSKSRVTSLTIPGSSDFSVARTSSPGEKERRFKALVYDDAELFYQLRESYIDLIGPLRFFSARSLSRIAVSGSATRAADAGYGWLHQPRSPRVLAYKGLTDTFSEGKILQHYRKPALGRSRYAFVHWAHRLAAAPSAHLPLPGSAGIGSGAENADGQLVRRLEQPEGLEFVVSWSTPRIVLAFLLVIALSVAPALLWTFLGTNTPPQTPAQGGFRDAGDRVGTGLLLGICCFLIGMSGIAGWLGISWIVL